MATVPTVRCPPDVARGAPGIRVRLRAWSWLGLLLPAMVVLTACFLVPLLVVLAESVVQPSTKTLTPEHYGRALLDAYYLGVLWTTVRIALVVTGLTIAVGYPVAFFLTRSLKRGWAKRMMYAVVVAPLFTSAIVRAFGWMVILGREGVVNRALVAAGLVSEPVPLLYNEVGVVIGSIYILVPFMVLSVAVVLQTLEPTLEEAAADLGASDATVFRTIVWPLSLPGVVAGATIVFALSMSSYVTPAVLGGGRVKVLPMLVYEQFLTLFEWSFGSALAVVLVLGTLGLVACIARFGDQLVRRGMR